MFRPILEPGENIMNKGEAIHPCSNKESKERKIYNQELYAQLQ